MGILIKAASGIVIVAVILVSVFGSAVTTDLVGSVAGIEGLRFLAGISLTIHCLNGWQMFFEWLSRAIKKAEER